MVGPDPWSTRERLIAVPLALVLVLPLGERYGLFDSWPSHALYASHCERSRIGVDVQVHDSLPESLRHLAPAKGLKPNPYYWEFTPTEWTLRVRGVPAYPQIRYANGLAEWLMSRGTGVRWPTVRVDHFTRADRLTNRRGRMVYKTLQEVRDAGDRFWFNAHPRDRSGK